tara:strand:+ start:265 stop:1644 length:1380 start_codon:yes stop_codon:yes gene_type:complete
MASRQERMGTLEKDATLKQKLGAGQYNKIMAVQASLEHFMTTSNKIPKAARRVAYSFRGVFSVVNKLNVGFGVLGKTLEGMSKAFANPEMGKGMKLFAKMGKGISKTLGPAAVMGMVKGAGKGAWDLRKGSDAETLGKWGTVSSRKSRIYSTIKERAIANRERGSGLKTIIGDKAKKVRDFFGKINWRGVMGSLWNFTKMAGKVFLLGIFYITVIALAIGLIFPMVKDGLFKMWKGIKESAVWIGQALSLVWEGLEGIFGFLFGNKSFDDMVDGIFKVAGGLLWAAWGIIWLVLKAAWELTWGIIESGFWSFIDYMGELWEESKAKFFAVSIYLLGALVAFALGFPVLLPTLLFFVGWKLVKWAVSKLNPTSWFDGMATGGISRGGLTVVGERGPELVNLPRGSRVHSNAESRRMGGNNINITINAHSLQDNELRRVAQKVGDMINRQVNRSTSSSTIR